MIIGNNEPIYEAEMGASADELSYLHQFILHSSLDMLQSAVWSNSQTYLKVIDRFNSLQVSAFVTLGGATFLMLHNGKSDDVLRAFFTDAYDIYTKYIMNPFTRFNAPIVSPQFDVQIKLISKKYAL